MESASVWDRVGALVYLAFIRITLQFYFAIVSMSQDITSGSRADDASRR
jgi:hypothetical protein